MLPPLLPHGVGSKAIVEGYSNTHFTRGGPFGGGRQGLSLEVGSDVSWHNGLLTTAIDPVPSPRMVGLIYKHGVCR